MPCPIMQIVSTDYTGIALIALAIILFIADMKIAGLGFLTAAGIVCMISGSILLFDSSVPAIRASMPLVAGFSFAATVISIFLVRAVILSHKKKILGGREGLSGEEGTVYKDIAPGREGKVFVHGEIWNAESHDSLTKDQKIKVVEVKGMKLKVKKA